MLYEEIPKMTQMQKPLPQLQQRRQQFLFPHKNGVGRDGAAPLRQGRMGFRETAAASRQPPRAATENITS